jgi:hypothetical protein
VANTWLVTSLLSLITIFISQQMMSLQRKMSITQAIEIDLAYESSLRLKDSYQFMSKQVGGSDNLSFTKHDHKNYLRNK